MNSFFNTIRIRIIKMMQKIILISLLLFCLFNFNGSAQTGTKGNSLRIVSTIPMPGVTGRIDHLAFDKETQMVYVAALGNNTVEVVDLTKKTVVHSIKNLTEPQGLLFIPENKHLLVANGGNGECTIFDTGSFRKIITLKLAGDADNIRYDPAGKRIYVGYGNGGLAVIDADSYKLIADIKLPGHPESFQLDKSANKIYVNIPDEQQIAVIDMGKNRLTTQWKVTEASSNFPMSLDEINHRLFIGCRHPSKLLILDTETGKTVTTIGIDSDVDDLFYNKADKQIYLSCGGGYIDVIQQMGENTYATNGKISTHSGARTSLFVPELNLLVVASPSGFNSNAALLICNLK